MAGPQASPLRNLVDNYEMMDGTKFDWNNATMDASPYENREARFYASVFYDGAKWKTRTSDAVGTDPLR